MADDTAPMIKKSLLVLISLLVIPSLSVKAEESAHEASFYEKLKDNLVRCRLCPRECTIADGKGDIAGCDRTERAPFMPFHTPSRLLFI